MHRILLSDRAAIALTVTAVIFSLLLACQKTAQAQGGFTAKVTSYCLPGMTRSGTSVRPGVIAVDPTWIPLGATVQIEGLSRIYVAEDTGGGVLGPHVDVWQADCDAALEFGVQYLNVVWWK